MFAADEMRIGCEFLKLLRITQDVSVSVVEDDAGVEQL
jgi:hypothetical protein